MLRKFATPKLIAFVLTGGALVALGSACAAVWGFEEPLDPLQNPVLVGDGAVADGRAPGCADEKADETKGIFVIGGAVDGGKNLGQDSIGCGDQNSPCATIATGIAQAAKNGKTFVYVIGGTAAAPLVYTESLVIDPSLDLKNALTIEGGWNVLQTGATFTYAKACNDPAGTTVVIQAPDSAATTVLIGDLVASSQPITLDDLAINTKAAAGASESLYAIRIEGNTNTPSVTITDVVASSSNGGNGAPGIGGVAGNPGDAGACVPATSPSTIDGSVLPTPPPGGVGSSSDGGTFTKDGIVIGDGTDGQNGPFGDNGFTPQNPPTITCYGACASPGALGGTCTSSNPTTVGGSLGQSGCGGYGGGAGKGGASGGSSVALYAWKATLTINGGAFLAGNGGAGGSGGAGANGGAGARGPNGASSAPCTTDCGSAFLTGPCATSTGEADGSAGTQGGQGGPGGGGGFGAGGDSFAIVLAGATLLQPASSTVIKAGTGGAAPDGGAVGIAQATVMVTVP